MRPTMKKRKGITLIDVTLAAVICRLPPTSLLSAGRSTAPVRVLLSRIVMLPA